MTSLQDFETWKRVIEHKVTTHVRANLQQYYPDAGSAARVVVAKPAQRRRFTVIFELSLQNQNGAQIGNLIAKAYRITPKKGSRDQDVEQKSRREFEFHQQVYEYFEQQSSEFSAVRPLDYLPDLKCLLIEKAEGDDLGKLIRQARYALTEYGSLKADLGNHFHRCGRWLSLMHEGFAAPEPSIFNKAAVERQVNHYYRRLMKAGGPATIADPVRQRILALGESFTGTPIRRSRLHGDFKLRHIFATTERIVPIDFGNEMVGNTFDDVARLLVEIRLLNYGLVLPVRQELPRYLQQQFLRGYFGAPQWPPLLHYQYIIWLWAKWDRRFKKFATNPIIKKLERGLRSLGIKHVINHTYVNGWFQRELNNELDRLESEVKRGQLV